MINSYTDEQLNKLIDHLSGTTGQESYAAELYDIDENDIEEIMSDAGYQLCDACGVWLEGTFFIDEDNELYDDCESCRR